MRTEQQAVLKKHRRPPDTENRSIQSEKCEVDLQQRDWLPSAVLEERRSVLEWRRPIVSKTAVIDNRSVSPAEVLASANEKNPILQCPALMQEEKDVAWSRSSAEKCDTRSVDNDSSDSADKREPYILANSATSTRPSTPHQLLPVICIDKPLPPSPIRELSLHDARPASPLTTNDSIAKEETSNWGISDPIKTASSIRRIKSYGDVLSASPSQLRPAVVERRASQLDLRGGDEADCTGDLRQHSLINLELSEDSIPKAGKFLSPLSTGPSKGGLVKKRSSSLGLGRRVSSASAETVKAPINGFAIPAAVPSARTVSSATAPPLTKVHDTEILRKRKTSVFGGLFGGLWKAKPKDTNVIPQTDGLSVEAQPNLNDEILLEQGDYRSRDCLSRDSELQNSSPIPPEPYYSDEEVYSQPAGPSEARGESELLDLTSVPEVSATGTRRRYSIISSFFRSSANNKSTTAPDSSAASFPPSPDLGSEPDPSLLSQPIDIPRSSLPQLPSLSQNLGELSLGSILEIGNSRYRGRSRASTNGSLQSFFSNSPKASLSHSQRESTSRESPNSPKSRSRSNSHLQHSVLASQAVNDSCYEQQVSSQPDAASIPSSTNRPKSPVINSIVAEERLRTRLFRSNSASSVTNAAWDVGQAESSFESKLTRPAFMRARSSSTISTNTASRALSPVLESMAAAQDMGRKARRPSIMVTSERSPYSSMRNLRLPSYAVSPSSTTGTDFDTVSRASRSSSISTGFPSPLLSNETFATTLPNDANLADAIEDYVLTPPNAILMRTSADTQVSGRSSYSAASSLLSSSPGIASVGPQNGKTPSILSKAIRRRANTVGSMLATSAPSSDSLDHVNRGFGSSDIPQGLNITGRNASSSRLSSFFSSPASPLSSSPIERTALWLAPHETKNFASVDYREAIHPVRKVIRRLSSSLLASPTAPTEDCCSSPSSPLLPATVRTDSERLREANGLEDTSSIQGCTQSETAAKVRSALTRPLDLRSIGPIHNDTPAAFLARALVLAGPENIAQILSEKADPLYAAALRLYLEDFDFVNDAIDIAIRKLLLGVHLPRETQQIDRVMQAFAERYNSCNPALFTSLDHPYILAFSIIMLHTDAFNKSNKKKMTRADYVKNTKIEGVSTILLEYIYDNITYAPFMYADASSGCPDSKKATECDAATGSLGNSSAKERNKLEVYRLIGKNQTASLRVDMGLLVPQKNPFSYTGTVAFFDCSVLRQAFIFAHQIKIPHFRTQGSPILGERVSTSDLVLHVVRVGSLERKDDIPSVGKKAGSRKWKTCGVLLLDNQLILLRDAKHALDLRASIVDATGVELPQSAEQSAKINWPTDFRADEIISLDGLIALYDFTYTRYTHTFRCIQPNGRQILFRASDDTDLNLWMSTINYAATFRTAGIRQPPPAVRQSVDLSEPYLPSHESSRVPPAKPSTATSIYAASSTSDLCTVPVDFPIQTRQPTVGCENSNIQDLMFPRAVVSDLEATSTSIPHNTWYTTRGDINRSKIIELENAIRYEQTALAAEIRLVRNIAILTPFTGSARQRLLQSAETVARGIRQTRQEIAKLICYRECLCRDLLATERDIYRQRFHQNASSSQHNLRTTEPPAQPDAAMISKNMESFERRMERPAGSGQLCKSASQDELTNLVRSPSIMKRNLTTDTQRYSEMSA